MTIQQRKLELAALSEQERAELASFLIESLEDEVDADIESAWEAELNRRAAEIHSGSAVGVPSEQVFAAMRGKYS